MSLNPSQWFTEAFEQRTAFSVRYTGKIYEKVSAFQKIEIFDTEAMGRVLILGGCFMVTEKDAFIYHEMLVHPAMAAPSEPRTALVIGGGDGGAVTELVKYQSLESITLCEIDPLVIDSCREHFPEISAGLEDPRVRIVCEDGAAFVRGFREEFDVVLVDSTDPVGPGAALFDSSFYVSVKASLKKSGTAVFQTESPLFMEEVFSHAIQDLKAVFGRNSVRPYLATVPCYPGGLWSFAYCSAGSDPAAGAAIKLAPQLGESLRYYNADIHSAAFALPECVRKLVAVPHKSNPA
jgi:spermidine synthase